MIFSQTTWCSGAHYHLNGMLKCSKLDLCMFYDINFSEKSNLVNGNVQVHDLLQDETVSSGTFCTLII